MNIFNKVTLASLKKSRTRTLVTIVGVALSAALITAVTTFGVSLLNYMIKGAIKNYGGWHVAFFDAAPAVVKDQSENPEVERVVAFDQIGYAQLDGGKTPEKPYLFLAGYSEDTFSALPPTLFSGRLPETSDEVIVSGKVASDSGVKLAVGDTVTLTVGKRMRGKKTLGQNDPFDAQGESFVPTEDRTFRIVGICQRPRFEPDQAPGYTLITKADEDTSASSVSVFVTLKNPRQLSSYLSKAAEGHAYTLNEHVLRFMGLGKDKVFNSALYAAGGIVIAIIMIGSVFLIYNAFHISLNERTQQFGILMSVGATETQLKNAVLFEGLCIGAVGIPIGMLIGLGGMALVIRTIAEQFSSILYAGVPLTMVFSLPALVSAALISVATILISAYLPAKKAVGIPVMDCIRQTNQIKVDGKTVKTSRLSERIWGLEGTLALKNFKRNKGRYRSIVLSLVLSVALFISTNAFVHDIQQMAGEAKEVTSYDIAFAARNMEDGEMLRLYEPLKAVDGVYASTYQAQVSYSAAVNADMLTGDYFQCVQSSETENAVVLPLQIQFLDETTYLGILEKLGLSVEEYTGEHAKLVGVAQVDNAGESRDAFKRSEIDLAIVPELSDAALPPQAINVQLSLFFTALLPDALPVLDAAAPSPVYFHVIAPYSLMDRLVTPETFVEMKGMTFRSSAPTRSAAAMQAIIEGQSVSVAYNLYNINEAMGDSRNYVFIVNVFAYTFITMISLIAIANVFNTISTNIKLRRRELAMLRSVGMAERSFQKMMNFECAFFGGRALLIGLPVSVLAAWGIHKIMFVNDVPFSFPFMSIGISIAGVLIIVFFTMLYAVRKIKRENIIDALRDDLA